MKEIGELLREAREEKGISLEDISKETKISLRLLSALERGDFSKFAGLVYLKGALRNYAETVGIDFGELSALYDRIIETRMFTPNGEPGFISNKQQEMAEKKALLIRKTKKPFPVVALIWIGVLAVVIGGSIWHRYQQPHEGRINYPGDQPQTEQEKETVEPPPGDDNSPEDEPEIESPTLTILSEDGKGRVYLVGGIKIMEIELSFTEDCWINLEQDGDFIEQKVYHKNDRRPIEGGTEVKLRFGYPPAVSIRINGQEVKLSGITSPYNLTIRRE